MTPYRNPQTRGERKYNAAHIRTRAVVERTFGLLKSRFRCLYKSGGTLLYSPNFVCQIIGACCVLHNYAMRKGLEIDICDDLTPEPHSPPRPRLPHLLKEQQPGVASWNVFCMLNTHIHHGTRTMHACTPLWSLAHTPHPPHIVLAQNHHAGLGSSNAAPRPQWCRCPFIPHSHTSHTKIKKLMT